jgi:hypothetical protein
MTMTMSRETTAALRDDELSRAIERISARIVELDRDLLALKDERERLKEERRQREAAARDDDITGLPDDDM